MRIGQDFEKSTLRACGHLDSYRFTYTNQRQRTEQEVRAARTICGSCRLTIQGWVAQHCDQPATQAAMWKSRLPELLGKEGQVKWAAGIRAKAGAFYFPLLEHLGMDPLQPAAGARTALRLLFSIDTCSFWIDARADLLSQAWLVNEVEILARSSDTFASLIQSSSAIGYWKVKRPELVESSRRQLREKPATAA